MGTPPPREPRSQSRSEMCAKSTAGHFEPGEFRPKSPTMPRSIPLRSNLNAVAACAFSRLLSRLVIMWTRPSQDSPRDNIAGLGSRQRLLIAKLVSDIVSAKPGREFRVTGVAGPITWHRHWQMRTRPRNPTSQ